LKEDTMIRAIVILGLGVLLGMALSGRITDAASTSGCATWAVTQSSDPRSTEGEPFAAVFDATNQKIVVLLRKCAPSN
jgi:hypothetical protein